MILGLLHTSTIFYPCLWWHVFLQPCRRCDFRGHRTWKVYDWGGGGVGWGGIIASMYACGTSWCYVDGMFLHTGSSTLCYVVGTGGVGWGGIIASMYACGTSWCYVDEMLPKAWWWSPWSTCGVNGLGRCECGKERKLQEPNKLIVVGNISRKNAPVKWRTALAQQSTLDSGIESINGSIATTCPSET